MKVSINAGGREVAVETGDTEAEVGPIADKVLELWRATEGAAASGTEGPAFGFTPSGAVAPQASAWLGMGAPMRVDATRRI